MFVGIVTFRPLTLCTHLRSHHLLSRHIFGLKADVKNPIHYGEDDLVIYPAGHCVIVYDPSTKQQRFLFGSDVNDPKHENAEIGALCVSPNKRFCAVAEKGTEHASIIIFDLRSFKKRKTLVFSDIACKEYVSMCFSPDSKSLVALGGPDMFIVNWQWSKSRPLQVERIDTPDPLNQVSFCPTDASRICVSGCHALFMFEVSQHATHLQQVSVADEAPKEDYTAHVWLANKHLLLGTSKGAMCLFDDSLFQGYIPTPPPLVGHHISAMVPTSRGVLVASQSGRVVAYLTHDAVPQSQAQAQAQAQAGSPNTNPYSTSTSTSLSPELKSDSSGSAGSNESTTLNFTLARVMHVDTNEKVKALALSMQEDTLCVATHSGQLLKLDRPLDIGLGIDSASTSTSSSSSSSTSTSSSSGLASDSLFSSTSTSSVLDEVKFEPLVAPFHTGPITGLAVCARKSIVASCGTDRTVRIWSFIARKQELCVRFAEVPTALALHPSGLYMLIAFPDKVKLCAITYDSIRPFKDLPIKNCIELQFANGGHLFAIAQGSNITVHSTYTCEQVTMFRGHSGAVRSLFWTCDDTAIIVASLDGTVVERRLDQVPRPEFVSKGCKFFSAVGTQDGKIYVVGDDRILREINGRTLTKSMDASVMLTQLVVSNPPERMLFAGTHNGVIRSLKFPLTGDVKDYQCHRGAVSRMRITHDDSFLVSAGDDGTIAIFAIEEEKGKIAKRDRPDALPYSDEVLVQAQDLDDQHAMMHDLEAKLEELRDNKEYSLRQKEVMYEEGLKRLGEEYTLRLDHDRAQIQMKRDERQATEADLQEKLFTIRAKSNAVLAQYSVDHQKLLMKEVHRLQGLHQELEKSRASREQRLRQRRADHANNIATLKSNLEAEIAREKALCQQAREDEATERRIFVEYKSQMEEDLDEEIDHLVSKFNRKLETDRDTTQRLKGANSVIQKKLIVLENDVAEIEKAKKQMASTEEELREHIQDLKHKLDDQKRTIMKRDQLIADKERRIYELKKSNQGLEKYKFVLDFQIKELKRQIEPREMEIAEMRETVAQLESRLEAFHRHNGGLEDEVYSMRKRIRARMRAILRVRGQCRFLYREAEAMRLGTTKAVAQLQNPNELTAMVENLKQTYVADSTQSTKVDSLVGQEYARQRAFLNKSYQVVKQRLSRDTKARMTDNTRVMQENVALIKEINQMRREIKMMMQVRRQRDLLASTAAGSSGGGARGASGRLGRSLKGASGSLGSTHGGAAGGDAAGENVSGDANGASGDAADPIDAFDEDEARKIVAVQKQTIARLRTLIADREGASVLVNTR